MFENGVYTACEPCEDKPQRPPLWQVKAKRIISDEKEKMVYFHNASFEFFGLPIAWIPYFEVADPSVKYHWWGFDVRFSKGETRSIATSTSGCTIVAGTIPDPTASKVVAAVCGALTLWADAAQDRGKCIAIKKPWVGGVVPWYWSC